MQYSLILQDRNLYITSHTKILGSGINLDLEKLTKDQLDRLIHILQQEKSLRKN